MARHQRHDPRIGLRWLPSIAFAFHEDPAPGAAAPGVPAVPGNAGGTPGQPGQPGQPLTLAAPPEGYVSQEEINRIVQQRLTRQQQQTQQQLQSLGFADWETLQQTLAATQQAEAERQRLAEEAQRAELEKQNRWNDILALERQKAQETTGTLTQQLEAERTRAAEAERRYHQERTQRELVSAATLSEAVHPAQVATLLSGQTRLEENGRLVVIDSTTGQVRTNGAGAEMTLTELTQEFLETNPHFRRAAVGVGANSAPAAGVAPPLTSEDALAKLSDPKWVRDNRAEAIALMKQHAGK